MRSNRALVEHLRCGVLKTPALIRAFKKVDRADFVPESVRAEAYEDYPLPIGRGQTISQPYTVAFMLELLQPGRGHKILDVGSGSGWTTALLGAVAGSGGAVHGVEIIPELAAFGQSNLEPYRFARSSIRLANSGTLGLPDEAPFDRILVSAAAEQPPPELINQLAGPGCMVIAVQNSILQIDKTKDGSVETREFPGFAFVPLV